MNEQPVKPKRRWLRFSLRTLFVLLTVACVVLGWKVNKARQQREAVEWVRENGGYAWCEFELDAFGGYVPNAEPPAPAWLQNLIGIDFFAEVTAVHNLNAQVSDVTPLANLTNLEFLWLGGKQVSNVTPLASLAYLTGLELDNTQVSDFTPLEKLTRLKHLWIDNSPISEESLLQLQKALPNCIIENYYDK